MISFLSSNRKSSNNEDDKEPRFSIIGAFDKMKNDMDEEVSE